MALPKIQHPLFSVVVPSQKKTIKFRQLTAREEKILLVAKTSDEDADKLAAIQQIVNNCVVTENFDINSITIFDLEYLFLKIRAVSIGNIIPVSYRDNADNQIYEFEINLDTIQVKWPIETPPTINLSDDIKMTMKWPSAELYSDNKLHTQSGIEALEHMIIKSIDKIYTPDQVYDPRDYTTEELVEFISDINSKAYEQIQDFFSKMPSMEHVITYTNSLGDERKIELKTLSDFFQF